MNFQEWLSSLQRDSLFSAGVEFLPTSFFDGCDFSTGDAPVQPVPSKTNDAGKKKELAKPVFAPALQEPEGPSAKSALQMDATTATPARAWDDDFDVTSCPTCYIPVLDAAPDMHGHTANFFGSIGRTSIPQTEDAERLAQSVDDAPSRSHLGAQVAPRRSVAPEQELDFLLLSPQLTAGIPHSITADVSEEEDAAAAVFLDFDLQEGLSTDLDLEMQTNGNACNNDSNWFAGEDVYQETLVVPKQAVLSTVCDGNQKTKSRKRAATSPRDGNADLSFETVTANTKSARALKAVRRGDDDTVSPAMCTLQAPDAHCEQQVQVESQGVLAQQRPTAPAARALPEHAVHVLKSWMLSPEHVDYPYPTDTEKAELMAEAGITMKQLGVWFTNARKRIWLPLRQMLGKPTPSYVDACLQRKVSNVAEMVARLAPGCQQANAVSMQQQQQQHVPAVSAMPLLFSQNTPVLESLLVKGVAPSVDVGAAQPKGLAELKATSAALAARKQQLKAMLMDVEQQEARVRDAMLSLCAVSPACSATA